MTITYKTDNDIADISFAEGEKTYLQGALNFLENSQFPWQKEPYQTCFSYNCGEIHDPGRVIAKIRKEFAATYNRDLPSTLFILNNNKIYIDIGPLQKFHNACTIKTADRPIANQHVTAILHNYHYECRRHRNTQLNLNINLADATSPKAFVDAFFGYETETMNLGALYISKPMIPSEAMSNRNFLLGKLGLYSNCNFIYTSESSKFIGQHRIILKAAELHLHYVHQKADIVDHSTVESFLGAISCKETETRNNGRLIVSQPFSERYANIVAENWLSKLGVKAESGCVKTQKSRETGPNGETLYRVTGNTTTLRRLFSEQKTREETSANRGYERGVCLIADRFLPSPSSSPLVERARS